jgi:hypothetical protein
MTSLTLNAFFQATPLELEMYVGNSFSGSFNPSDFTLCGTCSSATCTCNVKGSYFALASSGNTELQLCSVKVYDTPGKAFILKHPVL